MQALSQVVEVTRPSLVVPQQTSPGVQLSLAKHISSIPPSGQVVAHTWVPVRALTQQDCPTVHLRAPHVTPTSPSLEAPASVGPPLLLELLLPLELLLLLELLLPLLEVAPSSPLPLLLPTPALPSPLLDPDDPPQAPTTTRTAPTEKARITLAVFIGSLTSAKARQEHATDASMASRSRS
jgi:hypothetical protein